MTIDSLVISEPQEDLKVIPPRDEVTSPLTNDPTVNPDRRN